MAPTKYCIQAYRHDEWRHVSGVPFGGSKERAFAAALLMQDKWSRYQLFAADFHKDATPLRIVEGH